MHKVGFKVGLIALLVAGSFFLTNIAFAMCSKGTEQQADPNKKVACSCCCCSCCK